MFCKFDTRTIPHYSSRYSAGLGFFVRLRFSHLFLFVCAAFLFSTSTAAAQSLNSKLFTTRDGLAGNFITAIAFEPNGSAWIGTTEGATHISNAGWTSYTRAHGLGDSFITAITAAPDGRIWFGTQSGGVSVLDPTAKTFSTFNLGNSDIPSNFITALAVDTQNQVWIGTLADSIAQFDAAQNSWTQFEFPVPEITALGLDFENIPLVGTPNGVYHLNGSEWVRDNTVGNANVRRIDAFDGEWYLTTDDARFNLQNDRWVANDGAGAIELALSQLDLTEGQITTFGKDFQERFWIGTPRGIYMAHRGNAPTLPPPLPVVLIHGWTVAGDDTLETSEFRYIKSYADRDGIPMFYVRGVTPKNTLYQNAVVIRNEIARVKQETGADKVNIIAFSMGGMNTRAYLESSFYANDVNRAIILGTPQAGVEIWKPILAQQILVKYDEPSAIELSPEYAGMVVNQTRSPNPTVPYDLLIGDARQQAGLDFLSDMPASDALISVASALALDAPTVREHVNADLHDWGPQPVPIRLTGYLYPRDTWERYLRNALRNRDNAPIGSEVFSSPPAPLLNFKNGNSGEGGNGESNHTPVVTKPIRAGETITNTVLVDENTSARFVAYFPGGKIDVSLHAPDGKKYEPSILPRADSSGVLSLSTDIASFSGYVVKNAPAGEWQIILKRTDAGSKPIDVSTYVEVNNPLQLRVLLGAPTIAVGKSNGISASLSTVLNVPVPPARFHARIAQPAQRAGAPFTFTEVELFDDGQHNDGSPNDGTYGAQWAPTRAGWHLLFVQAEGDTFVREREVLFAVDADDGSITPGTILQLQNDRLSVQSSISITRAGEYAVSAVLRSADSATTVPIRQNNVYMLESGTHPISFTFDAKSISPGKYVLDIILLDAHGAAIELDRTSTQLSLPLP
jgi:pimeloyl-ACP methyl ester carboxylesterase